MKKTRRWFVWITLVSILLVLVGCGQNLFARERHLVIFYTNDEHGWLEREDDDGGVAELMAYWQSKEGYTADGDFLILSGGDMWTGPAISTWFKGESMVEAMNAMGYAGAAVGNHEFDFGLDVLRQRAEQMTFPLLSANIQAAGGGQSSLLADGTIKPYVIQDVNGIQVGIIGLSTLDTPNTTMPTHISELEFLPYEQTLREIVPQVRDQGAEVLIVIGHLCGDERTPLVSLAAELGISMIGGGHCHQRSVKIIDDVALVEGGAYLQSYGRVELVLDGRTHQVQEVKAAVRPNLGIIPDSDIKAIVDRWQDRTGDALSKVIGYTEHGIARGSNAMLNMVTDAWVWAYPTADVSMSNLGGFRQAIPAGEITLKTIVGVLPFENILIDVELIGAQLIKSVDCCRSALGGMTAVSGYQLADGTPIDPQAVYHLLVNDYMYAGGDSYKFSVYDSEAYNTAINWRQPVIDWIHSLDTSPADPLDQYLDNAPRY